MSTQRINFGDTNKTSSSELAQSIYTVSNIDDTQQDISLISDTSTSDPLSSQFSSPTPSQIASNPFNPPQETVTIIERILSEAHWNHSFSIVNSSPSFQSSLPLSFHSTPPIITSSSNSTTTDPDQHAHHCTGKQQPETTRICPTLPLKLDPKFVVPPPAIFGHHSRGEQLRSWAKQRITK